MIWGLFILAYLVNAAFVYAQDPAVAAAVAEAMPEAAAAVSSAANPLLDQLALSYFIAQLLEYLKKDPRFAWINFTTDGLNRTLAIFLSGLTAVGITFTYDLAGDQFILVGSFSGVLWGTWNWVKSYAITAFMYKATIYKTPSSEQLRLLQKNMNEIEPKPVVKEKVKKPDPKKFDPKKYEAPPKRED